MPFLLVLNIVLMSFLILIYNNTTTQNKKILFFPIVLLASLLWYIIYKTRENNVFSVPVKIFCRIFKFIIIYVVFYCLKQIIEIPHTSLVYGSVGVLVVFDFLRAYIFELSKASILNRLITGMFKDILGFTIIINSRNPDKYFKGNLAAALDLFYSLGPPKPLNAEDCFDKWSNRAVGFVSDRSLSLSEHSSAEEEDLASSLGRESVRDTVVFNNLIAKSGKKLIESEDILRDMEEIEKFDVYLESLVPPESYEFRDVKVTDKDFTTANNTNSSLYLSYPHDSDEATPYDDESDIIEDLDLHDLKWLFEDKWRQEREELDSGKVSLQSLMRSFEEEHAKHIYKVLTFQRSENLIPSVFRENIRQINNENDNLYIATDCSYRLLNIIYWTLILIEGIFVYTIISSIVSAHFKVESPLFQLTLPLLIVPILPSLKGILESFFFLVFSHPYDSGDRIHLDGENYLVRDINLMSTSLLRWDGMRCMIPNNKIKDKVLINIRRSKSQNWILEFLVDSNTSQKKLEHFTKILEKYVKIDNAFKDVHINFEELVDASYLRLSLIVEHSDNFQNGFLMWNNHSKFMRIVKQSLYILKIKYLPLARRVTYEEEHVNYGEGGFSTDFEDITFYNSETGMNNV